MEIQNEVEEVATKRGRKRVESNETQVNLKIRLPEQMAIKVRETLSELQARGVPSSPEDLLTDFLGNLSEDYFEEQLVKRTPDDFYLTSAMKIPEVRERILRQVKRAWANRNIEAVEAAPTEADGA